MRNTPAYARGKKAWGICMRSGKRMLLKDLVRDGNYPNLLVAPEWWEPKHPQEKIVSVFDPVALRRPSPDNEREGVTVTLPTYNLAEDETYTGFAMYASLGTGTVLVTDPDMWVESGGDSIITSGGDFLVFIE